jgi:hypothetical protein
LELPVRHDENPMNVAKVEGKGIQRKVMAVNAVFD